MNVYYVAVVPDCGCYTGVAVYDIDDPKDVANMAKDFKEWEKSGRTVKRVDSREAALENFKKCIHREGVQP